MRAQATVEFLMAFLATLAFVSIVAAALMDAGRGAGQRAEAVAEMAAVEEAVRALEVHANSGIAMVFGVDSVDSYRIENGRMHVDYRGKVIEAEGVFDGSGAEGQPV